MSLFFMYSIFFPTSSCLPFFCAFKVFPFASLSFLYLYLLIACLTSLPLSFSLFLPVFLSFVSFLFTCLSDSLPFSPSFIPIILSLLYVHVILILIFVFSAYLSLSSLTVFLFLHVFLLYLSLPKCQFLCIYLSHLSLFHLHLSLSLPSLPLFCPLNRSVTSVLYLSVFLARLYMSLITLTSLILSIPVFLSSLTLFSLHLSPYLSLLSLYKFIHPNCLSVFNCLPLLFTCLARFYLFLSVCMVLFIFSLFHLHLRKII